MDLTDILIIILTYLIGSLPWAFIIVRILTGGDISRQGSGNIGAMNSCESTGKKWIGIIVLILDAGKGGLAIYIAQIISDGDLYSCCLALLAVIFGHNFSIFLKFRGGRGLATAAGAFAMLNPLVLFLWGVMWITGFFAIKRNVHVGNVTGTIGAPILLFAAPNYALYELQTMDFYDLEEFRIFTVLACLIILVRHVQPMWRLIVHKEEV